MPIATILTPDEYREDSDIAPTRRRTPGDGGGHVPCGLAGYTYDGAAYCPDCATDAETRPCAADGETYTVARFPAGETDTEGFGVGVISGTDEWDYPGAACDCCHRTLDTNVLVYEQHLHRLPPHIQIE